jgi:hypothetical protein
MPEERVSGRYSIVCALDGRRSKKFQIQHLKEMSGLRVCNLLRMATISLYSRIIYAVRKVHNGDMEKAVSVSNNIILSSRQVAHAAAKQAAVAERLCIAFDPDADYPDDDESANDSGDEEESGNEEDMDLDENSNGMKRVAERAGNNDKGIRRTCWWYDNPSSREY